MINRTVVMYIKYPMGCKKQLELIKAAITGKINTPFTEEEIEEVKQKLKDPSYKSTFVVDEEINNRYNTTLVAVSSDLYNGDVDFIGKFTRRDKRAVRKLVKVVINHD